MRIGRADRILGLVLVAGAASAFAAQPEPAPRDPVEVVRAYLRAVYARDFAEAYRYVSSPGPVGSTSVGHLVEAAHKADYLDFVQCGFVLPVTLPAETEQEYSGIYVLRDSLPEGTGNLSLTYDVRALQ